MPSRIPASVLEQFSTFGDLLKFLRRRAGLTQRDLSVAVSYSNAHICRLEQNQRLPDLPTVSERFVPELGLGDDPAAAQRLLDLASAVQREDAPASGLPPYKGLPCFDEADSDLFFGREALVAQLAARLIATAAGQTSPRFLALLGASGSGKSSLLRAGLIPNLRWSTESAAWRIHLLTPTARPLESLAAGLLGERHSPEARAALAEALLRREAGLPQPLRRPTGGGSAGPTVLVVDQFEELFTLCRSEAERRVFVDHLMALAEGAVPTAPDERRTPTLVVIALRADFYAPCSAYPALREALAHQQEYIGGMTPDELRRAIEAPAQHGNWELEPGLVEQLLRDVGAEGERPPEPGALPLLSHALLETWQRRRGHVLTLSGYAATGGVRGAIAESADAVFYDQLGVEQRALARRIFLQLTEVGEDETAPETRRRASLDDLITHPGEAEAVRELLTLLADARLIATDQVVVEVAHEALIREWPTLREWLAEDREMLRLSRRLTEAAQEWGRSNLDNGLLYRGARLARAMEWVAAHPEPLSAQAKAFLDASQALAEQELREREGQRQRELEAAQRVAEAARRVAETETRRAAENSRWALLLRRRALYLGVALVLALVLTGSTLYFGWRADQSRLAAERDSHLAFSRELVAAALGNLEADPQRSLLLALAAVSVSQSANLPITPDIEDVLHRALWGHTPGQEWISIAAPVYAVSVAFSPDGRRVVADGLDNTAQVWDTFTGEALVEFAGHRRSVQAVAFSPDGLHVATASRDQMIIIWEAETGRQREILPWHDGSVNDIAFSPDGQRLASGGSDGRAGSWVLGLDHLSDWVLGLDHLSATASITTNFGIVLSLDVPVAAVEFSPDGARLAIARPKAGIVLWDVVHGDQIEFLTGDTVGIADLAFSPDGQRLAVANSDHTAAVWDASTGEKLFTLTGHTGPVTAITYSPDGLRLASAGRDGLTILWDAATGEALYSLFGAGAGLNGLAFSRDGSRLVTAGDNGLVIYVMRLEDLVALGRFRLTRWFTPDECQRYLHQPPMACAPPPDLANLAAVP